MKIADLSKALEKELNDFLEEEKDVVYKAVRETAKEVKDEIAENAPVGRREKYAKSWRSKETDHSLTTTGYVVYATANGYRLAHLLEFGHAKCGGGRTRAIAHIAPAEQHGIESLEMKLRRDL